MSHFENSELTRSPEPNISEIASHALLADSMPPFKVALKQEAKPIILASNDANSGCSTSDAGSGCSTRDVPPPVEQPTPTPVEIKPQQSQQQGQEQSQEQTQGQAQSQQAEALAKAQANNENHIANTGTVNGSVDNTVANTLNNKVDTTVGNTSSVANQVDASSLNRNANANNISVGGNTYKSYSNARGEALPGNECQTFAVRADGYFMGTGGALGLSNSDNKCIEAKAVKVNCDATETMSRANQNNSAAEQSWLKVASPSQQAEIINHGIKSAKSISDNVVKKTAECAQGQQDAPPMPVPQEVRRESQGNFATKEEIRALEQRTDSKLNAAYKHGMQK